MLFRKVLFVLALGLALTLTKAQSLENEFCTVKADIVRVVLPLIRMALVKEMLLPLICTTEKG